MGQPAPVAGPCPKHMVHGPCGGVRDDGSCELGDRRCSFVDLPVVRWTGGAPTGMPHLSSAADRMRSLLATRPVVVADLAAAPVSAGSIAATGRVLAGRVDAVLAGDAPGARVQFPPAYRASLLQDAGLAVWAGVNCRDRNRVALEGELAGLAAVDVAGVHCVTGDHTRTGARPDAQPVFDLDSTELAALARSAGHLVSVAESPAAPPTGHRAARLAEKLAAGAEVCFVNHCGGAEPAARFAAEVRDRGVDCRFIACVPLVIDAASAALLASFPGLALPPRFLDEVLGAADPRRAGIDAAVRLSVELIEAGLAGVNLSGGPAAGAELAFAEAEAEVATRIYS